MAVKEYSKTRIIPASWHPGQASGMFMDYATYLYKRDGSIPDWFPAESPNFTNFKMPRHVFTMENRVDVTHDMTMYVNKTDYFGQVLDWIYTNTTHGWNYGYHEAMRKHFWYFEDAQEAMLFKLVWGK